MSTKDTYVKTCCFDYSHNNVLTIESPSCTDFVQFLFGSSIRLGKIEAGFTSLDKLQRYRLIVIGGPRESNFEIEELKVLEEFVKNGGSLLVIHDDGGDYSANTNLSELTQKFGFMYNPDTMMDSVDYSNVQSRIVLNQFEPHPTSRGIERIIMSNGCSIYFNELVEADDNIRVIPLVKTGFNSYCKRWNSEEWVEEDAPKSIMGVLVNYYKGRVIGLPTVSMFSSLSSAYGYLAMDNQKFITNIFNWLLEPPGKAQGTASDSILMNVGLNYNLFSWMEQMVNQKKWRNVEDIVNFAVKYMKDNYEQVVSSAEERKKRLVRERQRQLAELKKIEDEKERQRRAAVIDSEASILSLADAGADTSQDLKEIMNRLKDVTGGEVGKSFDARFEKSEEANTELVKDIEPAKEPIPESKIEEPIKPKEQDIIAPKGEVKEPVKPNEPESKPTETIITYTPLPVETPPPKEEPKPIAQDDIKKEIEKEFQAKVAEQAKMPTSQEPKKNVSLADKDIDAALETLGSFDDFSKKLDEFKQLTGSTSSSEPKKDTAKKIVDEKEVFE